MSSTDPSRVVAVVVAYNRVELLRECLEALSAQTRTPDRVVVVDNASEDGTADAVRAGWPSAEVLELGRNTGGAGGFTIGLAHAVVEHSADLVWLMDDDTVPAPAALAELLRAMSDDVVLAGSRVEWVDGTAHGMNTPRRKPLVGSSERAAADSRGVVPIRSSSFVSMLVRADRVRAAGLPIADYFIWNDDFEFSVRMLRGARGVLAPRSVVVHKTRKPGATDADPRDRFYYEVRNKLWLFGRSRGLSLPEKTAYGVSTLRRWVRTYAASTDRAVLRRAFRRGVRDGLRSRPRTNEEVLAGLADPAALRLSGPGYR